MTNLSLIFDQSFKSSADLTISRILYYLFFNVCLMPFDAFFDTVYTVFLQVFMVLYFFSRGIGKQNKFMIAFFYLASFRINVAPWYIGIIIWIRLLANKVINTAVTNYNVIIIEPNEIVVLNSMLASTKMSRCWSFESPCLCALFTMMSARILIQEKLPCPSYLSSSKFEIVMPNSLENPLIFLSLSLSWRTNRTFKYPFTIIFKLFFKHAQLSQSSSANQVHLSLNLYQLLIITMK